MSAGSAVGRASFLRALVAVQGGDTHALDSGQADRIGRLLDLERPVISAARHLAEDVSLDLAGLEEASARQASIIAEPLLPSAQRAPLQTQFFALLGFHALDTPQSPEDPAGLKPLSSEECSPRLSGKAPHLPLVGRTRLWPALRRSLALPRPGEADLPVLVRKLACGETLRRLPRRSLSRLGGELVVVLQLAERLQPYAEDFELVLEEVRRLHGDEGLRVWTVGDTPFFPQTEERGGQRFIATGGQIPLPSPGTTVLILGDLGMLAGNSALEQDWRAFCRTLVEGGVVTVTGLAVLGARMSSSVGRHARLQGRGQGSDQRAVRSDRRRQEGPLEALRETLLAYMACCVRVEPGLLRSLRCLDPVMAREPGLEALVWGHAPVVRANARFCWLSGDQAVPYRRAFAQLSAERQVDIIRCVLRHHAWRGRSTEHTELLLWAAYAQPEARARMSPVKIDAARDWFRRVARMPEGGIGDAGAFARDLFARQGLDSSWISAHSAILAPLWAHSGSDHVPDGFHPADIARARDEVQATRYGQPCFLIQQDHRLYLRPDRGEQSRWPRVSAGGGVGWSERRESISHWLEPGSGGLELPRSGEPELTKFWLTTDQVQFHFGLLVRPSWAQELGRDRFGLYADAQIMGITQRFRYIEPGEFLMGSPEDEAERESNEGPQHCVHLTEGFWLADTACSQQLWQAVMGNNLSQLTDDPQNPVETVSWDDVEAFLSRLKALLSGVTAALPTEAEWEYVCRAGTRTIFSFGDAITPEEANYNGRYIYVGGVEGEYRQRTMPVKSFAPNPWGLYQMHGNVWEWCADGWRIYGGELRTDPRGPEGDAPRALRGGAWKNRPGRLRAAYRDQYGRGRCFDLAGFRFSLRPTHTGGREHLPESSEGTEGANGFVEPLDSSRSSSLFDSFRNVTAPEDERKNGPVPWKDSRQPLSPSNQKGRKKKNEGKK